MPPTSGRAHQPPGPVSGLPASAILSFLRQTRATGPWAERDLAKSLNIGVNEARQALAVMQLEGYVAPAGEAGKWRATPQGELVSGSKPPRFTREGMDRALSELRARIQHTKNDPNAAYKIIEAIAFGDFLSNPPRVQSAEVGFVWSRGITIHGSRTLRGTRQQHCRFLGNCVGRLRFYMSCLTNPG